MPTYSAIKKNLHKDLFEKESAEEYAKADATTQPPCLHAEEGQAQTITLAYPAGRFSAWAVSGRDSTDVASQLPLSLDGGEIKSQPAPGFGSVEQEHAAAPTAAELLVSSERRDADFTWESDEVQAAPASSDGQQRQDEEDMEFPLETCEYMREPHPPPQGLPFGPWQVKGFEFFSCFDSGNCANVLATPARRHDPDAVKKHPVSEEPPDILWAAEAPEKCKLVYKVLQNVAIRRKPEAKAKLLTKKSKGAHIHASRRVTLGGWQKLAGEPGWVLLTKDKACLQNELEAYMTQKFEPGVHNMACDQSALKTPEKEEDFKTKGASDVPKELETEEKSAEKVSEPLKDSNTEQESKETQAQSAESAAEPLPSEQPDLSFDIVARADCADTPFERDECQWFYFGMRGRELQAGEKLCFRILGLSRFRKMEASKHSKGQLLTDGLQPVFRCVRAGGPDVSCKQAPWQFVNGARGMDQLPEKSFAFTFEHTISQTLQADHELYFALTFPYTLGSIWQHLDAVINRLTGPLGAYVCRERLATSLGGHPIELVSITKRSNRSQTRQPGWESLKGAAERPWIFEGRQAVFISARVHPGETPASYMLEGLLDFLASSDPAAQELLRKYVFHVVPVLNPDGVAHGHHRLDLRGANLNRVYGGASLRHHPSVHAAEAACLSAHQSQGGLRLYLDLHAHSNRRGAFLLGDADAKGGDAKAAARLYGYALGRRCSMFEFAQSDFDHAARGTGKSAVASMTGVPMCFTVESHYIRGHHRSEIFGPTDWRSLGASCILALHDLDNLEAGSRCGALERSHLNDLRWAAGQLALDDLPPSSLDASRPSRAQPHFGVLLGPMDDHMPPPEVWMHPELIGQTVEIIDSAEDGKGRRLQLHEDSGGLKLHESDLRICSEQRGRFFYGVLSRASVSLESSPSSSTHCWLNSGTVIEVVERRVVLGVLRLRIVKDTQRGSTGGWISEFKSPEFDPKLGGQVQLMRLRGPPAKPLRPGPFYAFAC
eukprot:TRINITY_DN104168_c0_g1_i1.p1 TRINITY_DN104168_c0_g1~~TRINITY_DN104168_c0_g1_i1.p1  ORF type:complete len:1002 (+),score=176.28 TRINITY_DN104168_c0_g1_i1:111-3116(+)